MCERCGDHRHRTLSRRNVTAGAAALLAAGALSSAGAHAEPKASAEPAPNAIPPADALDRLMEGNARYAANTPNERDFSAGRAARAEGQAPIAAIVSCSDSRVMPDLVFDQPPGSLFVVRLAGNVVDDDAYASVEYAVKFLGVPLILVLGHSNCGVVAAAIKVVMERAKLPGHLPGLIKAIEPAVIAAHGRHPSDLLSVAIEENVRLSLKRLIEDAPIISDALAAKTIALSGGVYDMATGKVKLI
ncbi:MAG: carbonic anhydrase [Methylibium sp.]|jgi:carbonic anhydrase